MTSTLLLSALVTPLTFGQSPTSADNSPPADAKDAQSTQSSSEANLKTRTAFTGDWRGSRSSMADKGVTLDFRYTSFYQGLVSGTGKKNFEYGGKFDAFINLDSGKMGLWEGGVFRTSSR